MLPAYDLNWGFIIFLGLELWSILEEKKSFLFSKFQFIVSICDFSFSYVILHFSWSFSLWSLIIFPDTWIGSKLCQNIIAIQSFVFCQWDFPTYLHDLVKLIFWLLDFSGYQDWGFFFFFPPLRSFWVLVFPSWFELVHFLDLAIGKIPDEIHHSCFGGWSLLLQCTCCNLSQEFLLLPTSSGIHIVVKVAKTVLLWGPSIHWLQIRNCQVLLAPFPNPRNEMMTTNSEIAIGFCREQDSYWSKQRRLDMQRDMLVHIKPQLLKWTR